MKWSIRPSLIVGFGMALAIAATTTLAQQSPPMELARVDAAPRAPVPRTERQAIAYDMALRIAREHPGDLGWPWLNDAGDVIHRVVTEAGRRLVRGELHGAPAHVEAVAVSSATLELNRKRAMLLGDIGFPYADDIWRVEIDAERNRVVLSATRLRPELAETLRADFDLSAIAVRIAPPATAEAGRGAEPSGLLRQAPKSVP